MKRLMSFLFAFVLILTSTSSAYAVEVRSVQDLESYAVLNAYGIIEFDASQALQDGFPEAMVSRVSTNIARMNGLVLDGVTTIASDFTATVYFGKTRSNDTTYVEYSMWGCTIYYSIADTAIIVANLPSEEIAVAVDDICSWVGPMGYLGGYSVRLYSANIRRAAANGTGIYIQIYDDGTTAVPLCLVGSR